MPPFLFLLFCGSCAAFQCGVTFTDFAGDYYGTTEAEHSLTQMKNSTGANWVAVVPVWGTNNTNSTNVFPMPETVPDARLKRMINYAHSLGLRVFLRPLLQTVHPENLWIFLGQDWPRQDSIVWDEFFAAYTRFLVHYATLAEETGVAQFSLGTEILQVAINGSLPRWQGMIKAVRNVYSGNITYSGITLSIAQNLEPFWGDLDYVGGQLYFSLGNASVPQPTLQWANHEWEKHIPALRNISTTFHKGYIGTESGYPSNQFTGIDPYLVQPGHLNSSQYVVDFKLQTELYRSTFDTLIVPAAGKWLQGYFAFEWLAASHKRKRHESKATWPLANKPAASLIKSYYNRLCP